MSWYKKSIVDIKNQVRFCHKNIVRLKNKQYFIQCSEGSCFLGFYEDS